MSNKLLISFLEENCLATDSALYCGIPTTMRASRLMQAKYNEPCNGIVMLHRMPPPIPPNRRIIFMSRLEKAGKRTYEVIFGDD